MNNMEYPLNDKLLTDTPDVEPTRAGFGRGLRTAGENNEKIGRAHV